ncbi:hypothetical protein [Taibaiella lutea]|nr:hypothetical protein [Taibaiella lutea]
MTADVREMTSCTKEMNADTKEMNTDANANTSCSEEIALAQVQTPLTQRK